MRSVRRILRFGLLLLFLAACGSSDVPEYLPPITPEKPTQESPGVEPARPSGYIGDPGSRRFHRLDCPEAKEVKASIRQFYLTPFDALNEGYAPCEYCDPMSGWK
jgi:hypothetical protein